MFVGGVVVAVGNFVVVVIVIVILFGRGGRNAQRFTMFLLRLLRNNFRRRRCLVRNLFVETALMCQTGTAPDRERQHRAQSDKGGGGG